jgi:hypothetical protein
VLNAGHPFVYLRDEAYLVVVNRRRASASFDLVAGEPAVQELGGGTEDLLNHGVVLGPGQVQVAGFGYGIFRLATR